QHQRSERGRKPEKTDRNSGEFERIRDRESSVEYVQRELPDLSRSRNLEAGAARQVALDRAADRTRVHSGREPESRVGRRTIAGERDISVALDDYRAERPCIVAPDTGDSEPSPFATERKLDGCSRREAEKIDHRFVDPDRRSV